jgi:hypothetical protein
VSHTDLITRKWWVLSVLPVLDVLPVLYYVYSLYCLYCTTCTACTVLDLPLLPVLVLPVPVPVLHFCEIVCFPSMSQVGTLLSTNSSQLSHLVPIRRVQTPRARRKDLPRPKPGHLRHWQVLIKLSDGLAGHSTEDR